MTDQLAVTLKELLARLKAEEARKPVAARRHVPNATELAKLLGVTKQSVSQVLSNDRTYLNLKHAAVIMRYLRAQGFAVTVADILTMPEGERGHD